MESDFTRTGKFDESNRHERAVAERIRQLRHTVEPFGQALLSATVSDYLKSETKSLLRWLPDLAVMDSYPRRIVLVDAKNCKPGNKDTGNHSIEMRSLLTARVIDIPVWYVCQDFKARSAREVIEDGPDETCCPSCWQLFNESPDDLPDYCPQHELRGRGGTGKPCVLIAKTRCRPLDEAFYPGRGTS